MFSSGAYLAGYVAGDGHIEKCARRIVAFSNDERFLHNIARMINEFGATSSFFYDKSAKVWRVATRSKMLWEMLVQKYGLAVGNKLATESPPNLADCEVVSFLAGLYDAEGWSELDKGRYVRIRLKMKSRCMVNFVRNALFQLGIKGTYYSRREGSYGVDVSKKADVRKWLASIPCIHKKWLQCEQIVLGGSSPESPGLHVAYKA